MSESAFEPAAGPREQKSPPHSSDTISRVNPNTSSNKPPRFTSTTYPSNCLKFLESFSSSSPPSSSLKEEEGAYYDPASFPSFSSSSSSSSSPPDQCPNPLRILIVGAGLAGLSTAVALSRRGHSVKVLEQTSELGEVGAGIQVPPNSGRLLERWGVFSSSSREEREEGENEGGGGQEGQGLLLREQLVRPDGVSFRRWRDGRKIGYTDFRGMAGGENQREFTEVYGCPYYVVHRAHLHRGLYDRAVALGVEVGLGQRVVGYLFGGGDEDEGTEDGGGVGGAEEEESGDGDGEEEREKRGKGKKAGVRLEDGREVWGDLVVAADGIKSIAREVISPGDEGSPKMTGFAVYRATVDVDRMRQVPELAWILEKPSLNLWIGEDRHVMTYTISGGKTFNMVLSHIDHSDPTEWVNYSQERILDDMKREFKGWDSQLLKILTLVTSALKWPLVGGKPIRTWIHQPSSRLVCLGDAAHSMLPYMSQGAAMAVEDGAALAIALNDNNNNSSSSSSSAVQQQQLLLESSLQAFESERHRRTGQMQEATMVNAMLWHFPDGPEQVARDKAMRPEVEGKRGGKRFLSSPNQWSDPLTQWWAYGYDAEEAMEGALRRRGMGEKEEEKEEEEGEGGNMMRI